MLWGELLPVWLHRTFKTVQFDGQDCLAGSEWMSSCQRILVCPPERPTQGQTIDQFLEPNDSAGQKGNVKQPQFTSDCLQCCQKSALWVLRVTPYKATGLGLENSSNGLTNRGGGEWGHWPDARTHQASLAPRRPPPAARQAACARA